MVENRPLPLTWPMAYTTACTTVQAVILTFTFYTLFYVIRVFLIIFNLVIVSDVHDIRLINVYACIYLYMYVLNRC